MATTDIEPSELTKFDPGLTDLEVEATEEKFNFRFPPDLRAFLQTALPAGKSFPNWRSGDETEIQERLSQPLDGCLFDFRESEALRVLAENVPGVRRVENRTVCVEPYSGMMMFCPPTSMAASA